MWQRPELAALAALLAAVGTHLLYSAAVFGRRTLWSRAPAGTGRPTLRQRMDRAGLVGVATSQLAAASLMLFVIGATLAFVLFGGLLPALVAGLFAAGFPVAGYRSRRARRLATAREAWPRLLEELRLLTGSLGRSIPQGLFDVGRRAPFELQPAFRAAEREWLLTTDFGRTLDVLKAHLADPTADVVCETLAVAHEVGGGDLDRRLAELVEDRLLDLQGRKDAQARQAGVRFARRFVLLVPLGMTLAGLSIGTGRSAYETTAGQLGVVFGLVVVVACWIWSGRIMRLPEEPRIFVVTGSLSRPGRGNGSAVEPELSPPPAIRSELRPPVGRGASPARENTR
jgi:tight adherence protein B